MQLAHRFGELLEAVSRQIEDLPLKTLTELGTALLDFKSLSDAEAWIKANS